MRHRSPKFRLSRTGGPLRRPAAVAAAAALAAGALTGCGSSTGSANASRDVRTATADVARLSAPLASYPVPVQKLSGVSALRGRTVYYIPITQQSPQFQVTGTALKRALGTVGITLRTCDGNSNPQQITACVNQAAGTGAGAVVTDAVPYDLAAKALDSLRAKKIPVLVTDQITDSSHPADGTLGYIEGSGRAQLIAVADWIISDSRGKAKVVINESTDSPSSIAYVTSARQEFSRLCPGCTVVVNRISSEQASSITPSTSSAIQRTPGVGYVVSEFDQYLQPTLDGIQLAGSETVKGTSSAAQMTGLQLLTSWNLLSVDVGQASAYQGWADADAAMRLMLHQKLPSYTIPIRLFTLDNIFSVALTPTAQASGEWFGPTDFTGKFAALWGTA